MKGFRLDLGSLGLGLVAGAVVGSLGGYLLARKALSKQFDERLDGELFKIKAHYAARDRESRGANITTWKGVLADTLNGTGGTNTENADESFSSAGTNPSLEDSGIFVVPGTNVAAPLRRDTSKPYAIAASELEDQLPGWNMDYLTWYTADDVLVDSKNDPVRNYVTVVGSLSEIGFDELSGQQGVRLVRNEKLELDVEITLVRGSYADIVLGYGDPGKQRSSTRT